MTRWSERFGSLLVTTLAGSVLPLGPEGDALGTRWWSHIQYLADDSLEGRDTGSRGHAKAVEYMAGQFRAAGLEPAGVDGYRQPVDLHVTQIDKEHSTLELLRGGRSEPLKIGPDAMLIVDSGTEEDLEADVVFMGHGLAVPELGYDDFAGIDVKGKIVVVFRGGPPDMASSIKAHHQSPEEWRKAFRKAGAIGYILIPNPKVPEMPWWRYAISLSQSRMELVDPGFDAAPRLRFAGALNPESADRLLAGSGHTFAEITELLMHDRPLPHFPLAARIRAHVVVKRWEVRSDNVAGVLPGRDPELRKEYVVLSAHLDHLGIGDPVNGDPIYSGAMDNASGNASLIEVARALAAAKTRPRRSILFLSVTGEEKGLLGSQYYATHPTVPGRIVADVNMDCFNPLFPLRYLEVQGLDESTLGDDIRAVAQAAGVELQDDQEPDRVLFIRSDQYSFVKTGVPALTFKFGYLPGSPEEKIFRAWWTDRYHAPADDLDQPVDRAAAAQFDALLEQLTLRVANADHRPEWREKSFFRRFAK